MANATEAWQHDDAHIVQGVQIVPLLADFVRELPPFNFEQRFAGHLSRDEAIRLLRQLALRPAPSRSIMTLDEQGRPNGHLHAEHLAAIAEARLSVFEIARVVSITGQGIGTQLLTHARRILAPACLCALGDPTRPVQFGMATRALDIVYSARISYLTRLPLLLAEGPLANRIANPYLLDRLRRLRLPLRLPCHISGTSPWRPDDWEDTSRRVTNATGHVLERRLMGQAGVLLKGIGLARTGRSLVSAYSAAYSGPVSPQRLSHLAEEHRRHLIAALRSDGLVR